MKKQKIFKTQKAAAKHVKVTPRTIRRWEERGMGRTKEGYYIESELKKFRDLRKKSDVIVVEPGVVEQLVKEVDASIENLGRLKATLKEALQTE